MTASLRGLVVILLAAVTLAACTAEPRVSVLRQWQPVTYCSTTWLGVPGVLPCWRTPCGPGDVCLP